MSKNQITNTLLLGLMSIMFLVAIATWISLDRMASSNQSSHQKIQEQSQKMLLMLNLQSAIRNRQVSLRNLFLIDDPFDYDEERLQFGRYAVDFIKARNNFNNFDLNESEKRDLEYLLRLTREAQPKQLTTASLLQAGKKRQALSALYAEGLPSQDLVIAQLDRMVEKSQIAANRATSSSLDNYLQTKQLIFIIYMLCFLLASAIVGFVIKKTNSLEKMLLVANEQLELQANKDGLTGLFNRRQLNKTIEDDWELCSRSKSALSLIMIDIDHFKQYNDSFGHVKGDDALRKVSSVLDTAASRQTDLAARYGGEEFVLVLPSTPLNYAENIAEEIRANIEALDIKHIPSIDRITASVGVASVIPSSDKNYLSILEAADKSLYQAKYNGRNQVVVHDQGEQ
jgi:diguanylate cyclase (GGDEF)-like protein